MEDLAEHVSALAQERQLRLGTAESVTAGAVAHALCAAPAASQWFRGGIVAYSTEVKQDLLGVPPCPVISRECAEQMAVGARALLGADLVVATTGVGGPDAVEGQPAGTVWVAVAGRGEPVAVVHHFSGDPAQVLVSATAAALHFVLDRLRPTELTGAMASGGPAAQ
ncbi:MAG: CinA family protein [Actinomycetota bacterium]|nr:MAG: CinA family protein [Actinomycetota bacterium]